MEPYQIIIVVLAAALVVCLAALIVIKSKNKKKDDSTRVGEVIVEDGVRYTVTEETRDGSEAVVSHTKKDIVLEQGKTVRVGEDEQFLPGKYTVLTTVSGVESFNLRKGGYVREYRHGDDIVLVAGEEITAVSHTVILR